MYGLGFFLGASPAGQAKATGRVAANTQQVKPATSAPGNEEHEKPELVLQTGHAYAPLMLAFSADSRLVASADWYPSTGDGTIKLWEVATGRQLRTLSGHTGAIFALVFSPVKEILASSGDDGTIRIWNVVTGRELHRVYARAHVLYFSPDGKYLASLANTNAYQGEDREPDPELETCPHADKPGFCEAQQLNVWDVQGGRFLYTIPPPPFEELKAGNAWSFGFSPDEKTLASALPGKPVNFREVSSGRELPAIEGVNGAFAYDSAGKRIVAHDGNGTLAIWDVTNRKRLTTVQDSGDPLVFSTDRNLIVTMAATKEQRELRSLDATTGEMRAERRVSETYKGTEVRFGDKGKWAAAGAWGDGKIVLWNYMDGGAVPQVWKGLELPAAFSPDGKWAAATTESRLFSFIDLKNGKEICTTASPLGAVSGVAVSATTRVLASGDGTAVDLWDLQAGLVSGSLDARRDLMSPLFFTPDEKTLFSIDQPPNIGARWVSGGDTGDLVVAENYERNTTNCGGAPPDVQSGTPTETGAGTIPTWNIATGQLEYKFGGWAPVAMSADGKTLVTGAASRSDMQPVIATDVWNVERGNLVAEFVEPKIENRNPLAGDRVNVLAISSDGKLAAVATRAFEHPVISIWDITSRKQIAALEGHTDSITDLDFDSTGSVLASSSLDHTVKLWDLAHANKIRCSISTGEVPGGVSFGRDGQSLVVAEDDEAVRYQAWNCDPVRSYIGHGNTIRGIQSTSDDALLFTGSDDGSSRIWDRRSGELLATLVTLHGGADWMVVAPNGLFDGSPGAWSQMLWRFGGNTFDVAPAEIFFNEFYYPGLLAEIVAGKRPAAPSDITRKDRRQPEVKLEVAGATAGSATGDSHSVTLKVEVHAIAADNKHAHSSGVRDVRLFRNDSLVRMWHGEMKVDASGRGGLETTVKMVAGENKFTAYAFNDDNIKSSDASEIVRGDFPSRTGAIYIVAIGVNQYANASFQLSYARGDAQAFAQDLKKQQENPAAVHVIQLADARATRSNIEAVFARLAGTKPVSAEHLPELQGIGAAQAEDSVYVFFAGHGMANGERFYLLPHDLGYAGARDKIDAAGMKLLTQHGISDEGLAAAFENLDAARIVLVIDACNSGQALEAEDNRRGPMNSKGLAQLAYEKGMYILTAAQGYQKALESSNLKDASGQGHGLLTYALIEEGLEQGKAKSADGNIYLRPWLDYAVAEVPRLRSAQRPRVFYRKEPESKPAMVGIGTKEVARR